MILNFKGLALGLTVAAGIAMPAMAQNVGDNAGIWWNPAPGQPSAFTFLNPLTTVYGRIGFLHAWQDSNATIIGGLGIPNLNAAPGNAWGGVIGMGVRLMPSVRYELQLAGLFTNTVNFSRPPTTVLLNGAVSSAQILNNLYFDLAPVFNNQLWGFNPYLFGGIGVAFNRVGDLVTIGAAIPGSGGRNTAFAWNAGAGLQYQIMRNLIADLSYRYLDAGNVASTPALFPLSLRTRLTSHAVMVSIVVPVDGLIRGFGN